MATTSVTDNTAGSGSCHVHGGHARKANLALILMVLAGFALITWHVWVYGPAGHLQATGTTDASFLSNLREELWNLLTDKHGILPEIWDISPYFIVGVLLGGWIRTYKIAVKLQMKLRRYGVLSVFIASFVGIITPLCACGTLTTAISLLFAGIPLAPVMSLLVTSPLMSPSAYLITLNDLGAEWTVVRTLAALLMGIFAGLVTHFLKRWGFETKNAFIDGAIVRGDFHDEDYPDERLRCNCKQKLGNRVALKTDNKFIIFLAKSAEMVWPVGKYILVGVLIGAIVERYMPADWIYQFFGRKDPLNVLWITLASVPMFLHQLSASSILFHIKSSLNGTLDSSAALAFLIGGPVTAVPTLVMFWTLFRRKYFALYIFICLAGTLLITYSLQALFFVPGIDTGNSLFKKVSALSGGNSALISKQGESTRIAMDPDGKPLVATYINHLGNEGGAVFDASSSRFLAENIERFDNRRYVENIAEWLEQNSNATARGSILAVDISTGNSGINGNSLLSKAALGDINYRFFNRRELPAISATLLEKQSQVWLFFGSGGTLSSSEIKALEDYSQNGGSLLLVSGNGAGLDEANRIAMQFGVKFYGSAVQDSKINVAVAAPLFYRAAEVLGKLLKLTNKA